MAWGIEEAALACLGGPGLPGIWLPLPLAWHRAAGTLKGWLPLLSLSGTLKGWLPLLSLSLSLRHLEGLVEARQDEGPGPQPHLPHVAGASRSKGPVDRGTDGPVESGRTRKSSRMPSRRQRAAGAAGGAAGGLRCGGEGCGVVARAAVWWRGLRCGGEGCGVAVLFWSREAAPLAPAPLPPWPLPPWPLPLPPWPPCPCPPGPPAPLP